MLGRCNRLSERAVASQPWSSRTPSHGSRVWMVPAVGRSNTQACLTRLLRLPLLQPPLHSRQAAVLVGRVAEHCRQSATSGSQVVEHRSATMHAELRLKAQSKATSTQGQQQQQQQQPALRSPAAHHPPTRPQPTCIRRLLHLPLPCGKVGGLPLRLLARIVSQVLLRRAPTAARCCLLKPPLQCRQTLLPLLGSVRLGTQEQSDERSPTGGSGATTGRSV